MDPLNTSSQQQPIGPVPIEPHKSFVLSLIIGGVIILLMGLMGGFYLGKRQPSSLPAINTLPTIKPTLSPTPIVQDKTANWKTYTNTILGLSFKYPPDLFLEELSPSYGVNIIFSPSSVDQQTPGSYEDHISVVSMSSAYEYDVLNLARDNMSNIDVHGACGTNTTKITNRQFGQYKAVEYIYDGTNPPAGCGRDLIGYEHTILIKKDNSHLIKLINSSMNPAATRQHDAIFNQIISTFKFLDQNQMQTNGVGLKDIKYSLPQGWKAELNGTSLSISANGGGYVSIKIYAYDGTTGTKQYYCQLIKYCIDATNFAGTTIGNITGYLATGLDNSGGGSEYFGAKGNKFYIISSFSPSYPTPNEFDLHYKEVLNSLVF